MNILVFLGHPAHYHLFKNIIKKLESRNHNVIILIKSKEVLEDLCKLSKLPYHNILPKIRGNTLLSMAISILKKDYLIYQFIKNKKIDLLIGSEASLSHVGFLRGIPSFEMAEDDAKAIKLFAFISYPFFKNIISPGICNAWLWERKKIGYEGYHELAYLSPKFFKPDFSKISKQMKKPFFILRFSKFVAYHDQGVSGINEELACEIINILKSSGNIYITSEKPLNPKLEIYRININPLDIHHALYHADMFIGDSQTMTIEAAILGTPALRYNNLVGNLSVLEELDHKYSLTYGFKTNESDKLLNKIRELVALKEKKKIWDLRRQKMLRDKIDLVDFVVWFVENYPESVKIMKENPDYQERFR